MTIVGRALVGSTARIAHALATSSATRPAGSRLLSSREARIFRCATALLGSLPSAFANWMRSWCSLWSAAP
eukprot:1451511-Pyramimonas_sp.AAC.1